MFDISSLVPLSILAFIGLWYGYRRLTAYVEKQPEGVMKLWLRNAAPWAMCCIGSGIMLSSVIMFIVAVVSPTGHLNRTANNKYFQMKIESLDMQLQSHIDGTIDLEGQEQDHADLYKAIKRLRHEHIEAINNIPSVENYHTARDTFIMLVFFFMTGGVTLVYGFHMSDEVKRITQQ